MEDDDKLALASGQIDADIRMMANRLNVLKMLNGNRLARVRDSIEKLPIKLTLGNIGIFTVSLAAMMPRPFTYIIVYPIFRLVFGTLYPAYASYKAVRTKNVKEYVKWMMYWIVFALFTCAETFTDVFLSFWFPFYYEIKIVLVLWLLSPATKGSSILYRRFVHPALSRREAEIDEALARATEQGYTAVLHLGSRGVNYATTVLMQTAIKGGGGLVQQLKKSYSLSDLTGEKEDENRNTPDMRDEIDMQVEPRRRENVGRRGYSPRRTQSGSNRVDMYFSEVDVDVRQPRPREPVASLSNIRSSDDISSGYSSGEALHSNRAGSQVEPLVRTSSVGARTRPKPRSTTKKTPEESDEEASDSFPALFYPGIPFPIPPSQALELFLALSHASEINGVDYGSLIGTKSRVRVLESAEIVGCNNREDESSSKESSPEFLDSISGDPFPDATIRVEPEKIGIDVQKITTEICQSKFDELRALLNGATRAVQGLDEPSKNSLSPPSGSPRVSRSSSDSCDRAGRYNKKRAPLVPAAKSEENLEQVQTESALKARLVIKTGTVRTLACVDTPKEVFVSHGKKSKAAKTKEGLSRLLTIPKTIFHTAFHHKDDDPGCPSSSRGGSRSGSRSRSVSRGSRGSEGGDEATSTSVSRPVDVQTALLNVALDSKAQTYIDLRSGSVDSYPSDESKSEDQDRTAYERGEYEEKMRAERKDPAEEDEGTNFDTEQDKTRITLGEPSHLPIRGARNYLDSID
ncbi:uncharacterized protein LOC124307517 isoform X1 [Neodiprion virginianus]|uniref:uncharacterized protein LOC124307517 isoform X1 n=1 Tax=Neodiprion virginianus TaxID=2961670 RepID=UPI001EE76595|nr:uncharacterized protein LOC124307517 isoform X1 [Neodiprion virginianus]XP_046625213.1 uncharacterized protein LOC124307517 isoform X1 [Neodiprion virginianus]XP_046625214.1 uncharacterized protein LOC124307517 isoform X1 [Neodiprion virginianus]XP_046625215.1 uncharacterized protein LOC124307517 isoform X1 [Neodiprion virginianus]XP_046625216.1 uncharacterized protein LOC124307517 isoform X1 [Neodiprion virginianus]XP_046625217.1 uncharacterized protein LOC124307517 isoform X1 [Neodiprion 